MRKLVVFLLIVSMLLLMASPAYAVGFDAVSVAADIVLQSIVMGLGVFPKSGQESVFNDLISSIKVSDQVKDFIDATGAIVTYRPADAIEPGKRFVARALIQAVSNRLWADSNVIKHTASSYTLYTSMTCTKSNGSVTSFLFDSPVYIRWSQGYGTTVYWLKSYGTRLYYSENGVSRSLSSAGQNAGWNYYTLNTSYVLVSPVSGSIAPGSVDNGVSVSVVDNYVSGTIGQTASITSYPAWVDTETQVVGQTGVLTDTLALGLVDTLTQAIAMTQEQVIALQDAIQKAEVATQPEVPEGGDFTIDLRQFFPFCIPFDIYAILSALSAEPETPHLDFELDLGITKLPVHADLSAFDAAAAMLRKLELVLFIVGLGMVTREKFLRG